MKIRIQKASLSEALNQLSGIVAPRTTLPVLSNILIEAEGSEIRLTATDLDLTELQHIPATVDEEGAITLPAKKLASIIKELPTGEIVIETIGEKTVITSGPSRFSLSGLPADEFVSTVVAVDPVEGFEIAASPLKTALRRTNWAQSADESRYALCGILFAVKDRELSIVATDGRKLAMVEHIEVESPDLTAIIPSKAISELYKLLPSEGTIKATISEGQARFDLGRSVTLVTKLIEANYPNYQQVIPNQSRYRSTVEREVLQSVLKRVSLLVDDKTNAIRMAFADSRLTLSSMTPNVGESSESIDIKYDGPEILIGINHEYLASVLRALDAESVHLDIDDDSSPVVVKSGDSFLCVIMPMRTT